MKIGSHPYTYPAAKVLSNLASHLEKRVFDEIFNKNSRWRSKPLGSLSDAVGIDVIAARMPSLMQASEALLPSMTHPFGLQTVHQGHKPTLAVLAKKQLRAVGLLHSFARLSAKVTIVF